MSRKSVPATDHPEGQAAIAGSIAGGLDSINRAIRDGCRIHGIKLGEVATDGESVEIAATTLGRRFTVVIVPGRLDAPDAPAILRPAAGFEAEGCGAAPRAAGFRVYGPGDDD